MTGKLLVVLAHPDDETFICGGTLALYAQAGWQITLVCATKGEMGSRVGVPAWATRESLPALREAELRAACRALGITDLRFLGLRDKTVEYLDSVALARRIAAIMREVAPDVVLTFHEATGGHPDHCAIGLATQLAYAAAGGEASLYYVIGGWYSLEEQLLRAEMDEERLTRIAINGAAAAAKIEAYQAHRTQSQRMTWLWGDRQAAIERKTGEELFLQGSGPARPGETELLPGRRVELNLLAATMAD
jgi:bacillithiol biosynthesis deacetylase BshB2